MHSPRTRPPVAWAALPALLLAAACGDDSVAPAAPTACGAIASVTINVGETSNVTACFNDVNGDVLTYSATSSNPSVVSATVAGTAITVTAAAPGNATVTITATDPGGLSGQQSFAVAVPNRAPQPRGTPPAVTVEAGATTTVEASQYFSEPDGETLSYTATASDAAVASTSVSGSTITVTALAKGSATVTITASDPGGLSADQSFQITVPNRPPAAVGTTSAQTIEVGQSVTVDFAALFTDPDGDPLTLTAASSIAAVARASVSGSTVTVTGVGRGTTTITVTASDPEGLSATQQMQVTVLNRPPVRVGSIPAQSINAGERATVNASPYFSDPDGDALTYSATSSNSGVATVSVSGSDVAIQGVRAGSTTISVTASDPEGLTATQQIQVTVLNRAPRPVGSVPAQTLEVGGRATVNASQYFSDPDGDALTYSATSSNSGVARTSVSGSSVAITGVSAGSATITVTARDPGGLSATQSVSVRVSSTGAPDLEFTGLTPTSVTGTPGGTVQATFTLRNRGNAAAPATTIRAYRSNDATITTSDSRLSGTISSASLGAGQTRQVNVRFTLSNTASGTFYYGLCIDAVTGETNTGNNCSQGLRVTVGGSSACRNDLGTVRDGRTLTRTGSWDGSCRSVHYTNGRYARYYSFTLAARLQVTIDLTSSVDTWLALRQGGGTGGSSPIEVDDDGGSGTNSRIVRTLAAGTYTIEATTFSGGRTGPFTLTVAGGGGSGGPDLVVTLSRSSATVAPGGTIPYTVTVRNQGSAASAATTLRVFQSTDATITTSDHQLGTADVPAISPSRTASGNFSITIRSNTPAGTYYFGLCVDAVSGESNTNNNCSSALTVTVQTGGGGSDTTYTVGQTIETLPTGSWFPDRSGGGVSIRISGGVVTIQFNNNTTAYFVEDNIRYTCLTSSGCEIVNRRVTRGSIRARPQSGPNPGVTSRWNGLPQVSGGERSLILVPPADGGTVIGATITEFRGGR